MQAWLSLLLCYAGFVALAMAMPRHHEQLRGAKPNPAFRRLWQALGVTGLTASLLASLAHWPDRTIAISAWTGIATVAAFALAMVLTWSAPGRRLILLALPAGSALALCAITALAT